MRKAQGMRGAMLGRCPGAACEAESELSSAPVRKMGTVEAGVAHPRRLEQIGWVAFSLLQLILVFDGGVEVPISIGARIGRFANPVNSKRDPRAQQDRCGP